MRIHGQLHCAAPLENQATSTMIKYPTQLHYPATEPTSPCPILIMPSAWLGSDKYTFIYVTLSHIVSWLLIHFV